MKLLDELTAPGREIEALLRLASKGNKAACRALLAALPPLLVAEERWVLSELAKCDDHSVSEHLARHIEAHDRMRAVIEQFRDPAMTDEQSSALLRILDAMLQGHLRAERAMYDTACRQGWLSPTSSIARFARRAGGQAANVPDYRLLG